MAIVKELRCDVCDTLLENIAPNKWAECGNLTCEQYNYDEE